MGRVISRGPQNHFCYPRQFDNAYWTKTRASIDPDTEEAPDASFTGDFLQEDNSFNTHFVTRTLSFNYGVTYCASIFAKAFDLPALRNIIAIEFDAANAFPLNTYCLFNMGTGATQNLGAGALRADMEEVGNDWWHCWLVAVCDLTTTSPVTFYLATGFPVTYQGDGSSGLFIWQAQVNEGMIPDPIVNTTEVPVS